MERFPPGQPHLVDVNVILHNKSIPAFKGIGFPPKLGRNGTVHPGMAENLTSLPLIKFLFVPVEEEAGHREGPALQPQFEIDDTQTEATIHQLSYFISYSKIKTSETKKAS